MASKVRRSRRWWSEDFKRRVVSEALAPGASVAAVARHYDLNANLLFNWRRRYGAPSEFLPVEVAEVAAPVVQFDNEAEPGSQSEISSIEVALANGTRVSVQGPLDIDKLCRVMRSLSDR